MLLLVPNTPFPLPPQTSATLKDKARTLNAQFRHHSATDVMQHALSLLTKIALVSSFGAESVVLLHMAAVIDQSTPVLFIDTQMLFTETLVNQQDLTERLGLRNLHIIRAANITTHDLQNRLHKLAPNACCALRKTAPLQTALTPYDGWITGRKRFQSGTRSALEFFEVAPQAPRLKINPLPIGPRRTWRITSPKTACPGSDGGTQLPVDRLRALHHPGGNRRSSPRRTLARHAGLNAASI